MGEWVISTYSLATVGSWYGLSAGLERGWRTAADEHACEAEIHAERDVRSRIACKMRTHKAQVSHECDRAMNVSLHCLYRIFGSVGAQSTGRIGESSR